MTSFERRTVLKTGAAALTAGLAGCFADNEGVPRTTGTPEEPADYENGGGSGTPADGSGGGGVEAIVEEYLSDVPNFDGTIEDLTGEGGVTVQCGSAEAIGVEGTFVMEPAAVRVEPGTTVTWEWIGEDAHSVTHEDGEFDSGIESGEGTTFEYTFENEDAFRYFCQPHRSLGQKGVVVVGGGGGSGGNGGGGGGDPVASVDTFLTDNEANLYDGEVADLTGESEVTVDVGAGDQGFAFDPAAVRVDPGTTVVWEWTGAGGGHNILPQDGGDFDGFGVEEIINEEGNTEEATFEESGVGLYLCDPHRSLGMYGGFIVE